MTDSLVFTRAADFREQHGCFVALIGGPNSGKTFSAMRVARGMAGPKGRIAVLDTEGGRTLHLKEEFDFDVIVMGPPHRPARYLEVAQAAQAKGYAALVIDSWSQEWRGIGGVLDWADDEAEAMLIRKRARAKDKNWNWDEAYERDKVKFASLIRPKSSHKLVVNGFLGLRIPILFCIRGQMTVDPNAKAGDDDPPQRGQARRTGPKEVFKAMCDPVFPFELTVSFRLAQDRKGVVDLSDASTWKMERAHQEIFRDGDLLSEDHGARLMAWARGQEAVQQQRTQAQRPPERPQPAREPERVQQQQQRQPYQQRRPQPEPQQPEQPRQAQRRTLGAYLDECLAGCRTVEDLARLQTEDPAISAALSNPNVKAKVEERIERRYFELLPPPPPELDADEIDTMPLQAAE